MPSLGPRTSSTVPASVMMPRLLLLLAILCLTIIGCVMIYSSSIAQAMEAGTSAFSYLRDQLIFVAVGVVFAAIIWKFLPCSIWRGPLLWIVWLIAVALLVLVAVMGIVGLGAKRWLILGPISFQPSEFAKIALVLVAARLFCEYREGSCSVVQMLLKAFLLIAIPVAFLYATQSDLGTTIIIAVGILAVLWLGEVPLRFILGVCVLGVVFVVVAIVGTGYRSDRMLFLNPLADGENGLGKGFQLIHSYYAFSEGGLFGVGLGNSREKFYLPEAETDFIFAIVGEELGMVGALAVVVLFILFLYAGMRIAKAAANDFATMVAGSCTLMLVFQAFLNIGCVVGLLPTTGKPLPFVSSGGSSLIATFIMVGLILSVSKEAGGPSIYEKRRADLRVVRAAEPDHSPSKRKSGSFGGR